MEFGWTGLNCVEGAHFVVWGGDRDPKTRPGLLLRLHSILCPSDEMCFDVRLFFRKDSAFGVKFPSTYLQFFFFLAFISSLGKRETGGSVEYWKEVTFEI